MVKKKVKNPLRKRYLREIKSDFGKYLAIFLLMLLVIGEVSGYLVADESMIKAYNDSFEKYRIENGNFTVQKSLNKSQKKAVEGLGVSLNELFFSDVQLSSGQKIRIFQNRTDMNQACVMEGRLAEKEGEIAIDRMFADNNHLKVGDILSDGTNSWEVTGLVALSDYSALFEDNNDSMFDAVQFCVGVVSPEEFAKIPDSSLVPRYAWKYQTEPADEKEEKTISDDFLEQLKELVHLEGYIPRYLNQAIRFTGEDMGGDKAMMSMFLYIVIVILAFVFGVTISNTIAKEANAIGTLRASGFTKGEMIRHYMAMPILVTLVAALCGNIFGYTIMKNVNASLYYGSYSLPTYVTIWSASAFLQTTLIPIGIMLVIDFIILRKRLSLSPLNFLRRDLKKKRKQAALKLSRKIRFFTRFRLRVILQNIPNYVVLFIGILFADLLLMFGLLLPVLLDHYQETLPDMMLAKYQYILTIPESATDGNNQIESLLSMYLFSRKVETDNPDAEKFMAYTLRIPGKGDYKGENVMIYGIDPDSAYVDLDLKHGEVYFSSAYTDKFHLSVGDKVSLSEEYEDKDYSFKIDGIYDYAGALALFMPREDVNALFDFDPDMFAGYFSDSQITDIPGEYIGQVIDFEALSKISRQLDVSMGDMMNVVVVFSVAMFLILMYVLSKMIIEKNAQAISMTKILGYQNKEISKLYVNSTSIVVVICLFLAIPIVEAALKWLYETLLITKMSGWIPFYMSPLTIVEMLALGLISYFLVSLLEYRKVKKIPMDEALKNVE